MMPLSKQRDRERKRLARLESTQFQPNPNDLAVVARANPLLSKSEQQRLAVSIPEIDADGNVIPEY